MKYIAIGWAVIFLNAGIARAQGDIATDRPSESAAATVVPEGFGRAEIGGVMNWTTDADGLPGFSYSAPLGVMRYGVREGIELRAGARFAQQVGEVQDALLGAKLAVPGTFWGELEACWLAEFGLNPGAQVTSLKGIPMSHRLCVGRSWGQLWSATSNLGWAKGADGSAWMASMVVSRVMGVQGWSAFLEPFAFQGAGASMNLGFQRTIDDTWMMDFVYGRHLETGDVQVGLGVSFTWVDKGEEP
jgi:hypothetical protein